MRTKGSRQAALLRAVKRRSIASQEEMVRLLRDMGFTVTQSSVSRDVRELGLVRVRGRYVPAGQVGREQSGGALENELIVSVEPVGANLVVVRTPPGGANAVAVELDGRHLPDIAGTLAGDDTIFVAVRSRSAQGRLLGMLGGARAERSSV